MDIKKIKGKAILVSGHDLKDFADKLGLDLQQSDVEQ